MQVSIADLNRSPLNQVALRLLRKVYQPDEAILDNLQYLAQLLLWAIEEIDLSKYAGSSQQAFRIEEAVDELVFQIKPERLIRVLTELSGQTEKELASHFASQMKADPSKLAVEIISTVEMILPPLNR